MELENTNMDRARYRSVRASTFVLPGCGTTNIATVTFEEYCGADSQTVASRALFDIENHAFCDARTSRDSRSIQAGNADKNLMLASCIMRRS